MAFSTEPSKIAFPYMENVVLTHLKIREILNMIILPDHNAIGIAPMALVIYGLVKNIENIAGL